MITFSREGSAVIVNIKTGLYGTGHQEVKARIECSNTLFAELLVNQIENKFTKVTEEVRRIEYQRGRRRNKKQDYFYWGLGTDEYPKGE